MSVELRHTVEGECTCGVPYPTNDPPPPHGHHVLCEWGVIEHSDPRPDRGQIGHLMLITRDYVEQLAKDGPVLWAHKGWRTDSVTLADGRCFAHLDWHGKRWTWELFDAHWSDGCKLPIGLMVGRWPD